MLVEIRGKKYELEYDSLDHYVSENLKLAYCDQLAADFAPFLFDPKGYGSCPFPPDVLAYRLLINPYEQLLCVLYEVYWRRQDCSWKELNKDHDHDYEQIQVQLNLKTGETKYIISSVGPVDCAGHGVEVFSNVAEASFKDVEYATSPKKFFPWGGDAGQKNLTQIRFIPVDRLLLDTGRPEISVVNCYHAFTGVKVPLPSEQKKELSPALVRLDLKILDKWYYRNAKNRYGHDISNPFTEPFVKYYPPPEDLLSRFVYGLLWVGFSVKRFFVGLFSKTAGT